MIAYYIAGALMLMFLLFTIDWVKFKRKPKKQDFPVLLTSMLFWPILIFIIILMEIENVINRFRKD